MRLPRTITLPARNALMALPYWPEPPGPALMSSMRLSRTSVPSSPIAVRRISMPLSLVSVMVLRATIRPSASNETTAVVAPDAVAAAARYFAVDDTDVAAAEAVHETAPLRQRNAAAVEGDAGQADIVGTFALQHRGTAIEYEPGHAAYADELRAALQAKHAGTID